MEPKPHYREFIQGLQEQENDPWLFQESISAHTVTPKETALFEALNYNAVYWYFEKAEKLMAEYTYYLESTSPVRLF